MTMTLTDFFMQLKEDFEQSGVYIDKIDESNNALHLTFKATKKVKINVANFVSHLKRVSAKYGFKELEIFTKIEKGGE